MGRRNVRNKERRRRLRHRNAVNKMALKRTQALALGMSFGLDKRRWLNATSSHPKVFMFFGEVNKDPYSNMSRVRFFYAGRYWRSTEHAYQCMKAKHFGMPNFAKWLQCFIDPMNVKKAVNRSELKRLSTRPSRRTRSWDDLKTRLMYTLNYEKFSQNPQAADTLLKQTPRNFLVEAAPYDKFWGIGQSVKQLSQPHVMAAFSKRCGKGPGQNRQGHIVMAVRERMRFERRLYTDEVTDGDQSPVDAFVDKLDDQAPVSFLPDLLPIYVSKNSMDEKCRDYSAPEPRSESCKYDREREHLHRTMQQEVDLDATLEYLVRELPSQNSRPAFPIPVVVPHESRVALEAIEIPAIQPKFQRRSEWNGPSGPAVVPPNSPIAENTSDPSQTSSPKSTIFEIARRWKPLSPQVRPLPSIMDVVRHWEPARAQVRPLPLSNFPSFMSALRRPPGPNQLRREFGRNLDNPSDQPGCSKDWRA